MNSCDSIPTKTVLIVDDDEAFSRVLCRALSRRGFNAWPASNLQQAQAAVKAIKPDFAVVDLHLADENGLDVVRQIKQANPSTNVVMLSGYINLACAVQATKLGAADCLTKPIEPDELILALTSAKTDRAEIVTKPEMARLNHIIANWEKYDRNTTKTAQALRMQRRTLQRILHRLGLQRAKGEQLEKAPGLMKLRRIYRVWARHILDHDEPIVRM